MESITTLWKYHLGSILIGSILNPLLRLPRVLISGIKGKVKEADMHCANCCVTACCPFCYCHEKLFKYFSDNADAY